MVSFKKIIGWANRIKSEHMKFFFSNPNLN